MTTKDRIETAAIQLFADQGVDGTAGRDIAQAAGVADGALYRHYPSKDALCQALFSHHYQAIGEMFEQAADPHPSLAAKLSAVIKVAYELFDRDRALFTFILLSQHDHLPGLSELNATPVDAVAQMIVDATKQGEVAFDDTNEITAMIMGLALQPAIFTIYGRLNGPLTKRAQNVANACCRVLELTPETDQGSST